MLLIYLLDEPMAYACMQCLAGVAVRFYPHYASHVLAPLSYPSREPLLLITSLTRLRSRYDNEQSIRQRQRDDEDEEDDSDDERRRRERHRRQRDAESDDGGNAPKGLSRRYREGNQGAPTGPAADDRGSCWEFQRGRCTRGGACRFSHTLDGPGGGGGGYGKGEYVHSGGYGKGEYVHSGGFGKGYGGRDGSYGYDGGHGYDGGYYRGGGGHGKGSDFSYGGKGGGYGYDAGWGYGGKGYGGYNGGKGGGKGGGWGGGWEGARVPHGWEGGRGPPLVPHDYKRMEGDTAPIEVRRVDELLSRRVGAKRSGDFHTADAIRNELRVLGVAVLDQEREWHVIGSDGYGRPDSGAKPYGGYGGAHNMSERFGERGHDYRRADEGVLAVDEPKVT